MGSGCTGDAGQHFRSEPWKSVSGARLVSGDGWRAVMLQQVPRQLLMLRGAKAPGIHT